MNALIVGLSGVTNGGKTTLSQKLFKFLPAGTELIKEDSYFRPEDSPFHVPCPDGINHSNWEIISALDIDQMVIDIKSILSQMNIKNKLYQVNEAHLPICNQLRFKENKLISDQVMSSTLKYCKSHRNILLLDGFNMYDDHRLREMCEIKIFITLSKNECFARRQLRTYDPPDPPGYFDACVWPMYEAHLEKVKQYSGIKFYDGTKNEAEIFTSILQKIVRASVF